MVAIVQDGVLKLDVPTDLPEGTRVEVISLDDFQPDTDKHRALIEADLVQSQKEIEAGLGIAAAQVLEDLRNRNRRSL